MTFGHSTTRRRISHLSLVRMIKAMQEEPLTVYELAEASGLTPVTVRQYVLTMHREKACHVGHWEQDGRGRYSTAAYVLGKGKDAAKPKARVDRSGYMKAYRQRVAMLKTLQALRLPEDSISRVRELAVA